MHETLVHIRRSHKIFPIFAANFFIALHYILVIYINSSFLGRFLSKWEVSLLYALSAIGSFIFFAFASRLVRRFSNFRFLLGIFLIEGIALFSLSMAKSSVISVAGFVIYFISVYAIFYSMDVFLETAIKREHHTGLLRAIFLTVANFGIILGPSLLTFLVKGDDYGRVYLAALFCLIPAAILAYKYFGNVGEPKISHFNIKATLRDLVKEKNVRRIIIVNFILQFFFAWMVVFTPLYLHESMGIPWSELGLVLSFMLLPFLLFQIPAGEISDRFLGEKEMLVGAIILTAISTAVIPFINVAAAVVWAILLFVTRVGASIIEVSSDAYFFKHVTGDNANLIGAYRSAIPLSLIAAPLVFSISSLFLGFAYSYFVLAAIVLLGLLPALKIKDTL